MKSEFGIIGLGVMGKNLALNFIDNSYRISVFNRIEPDGSDLTEKFRKDYPEVKGFESYTDLKDFVHSLERPRKILLMIQAGSPIDECLELMLEYLTEGDIVIDGGNSHFLDTARRQEFCLNKNIFFLGCGISGGEKGARYGPSMMPSGDKEAFENVRSYFQSIAATNKDGWPCCQYIGPQGAGHFVKMVHNGIEYVEMQLLAEIYTILKLSKSNEEISEILNTWKINGLGSFLLEITINILSYRDEDGTFLIDKILDKAENKGTGSWSSKAAFDFGTVNNLMAEAVFSRYISYLKNTRTDYSKIYNCSKPVLEIGDLAILKNLYHFVTIVNHHQGFEMINSTSKTCNWNINIQEIAKVWTNGCIIRSEFMNECVHIFEGSNTILEDENIANYINESFDGIKLLISKLSLSGISIPVISTAYNYFLGMTSEISTANLIQAQRDYFGSHTYQRNDDLSYKYYHTDWDKN